MTDDSARKGHLNLLEFTREDMRWQRPHEIVERDGVLMFAGASEFPAYNNGVHRADDTVAGADLVAAAQDFFGSRRRGFSLWARNTETDDDLRAAFVGAGYGNYSTSPQMICRARLDDQPLPDGVEIQVVDDAAGAVAYAELTAAAYTSLGAPFDATRSHFNGPRALIGSPNVYAVVASLHGKPASAAMVLFSHGIAGVYWVATVEEARGHGLAELVTRHVTNTGFDLGAESVQLQASPMGEPVYRRMGYEDLYSYLFFLAGPPA